MAEKDPGYSPFVQAVAGDGSSAPEVRMLTGWLAPSGEEGHVRLYLDPSLSTYVDIPRDAILYSEEVPNSHPSGARTVWVKGGADVKEGGSALARASKFLSGSVQQDYLGGAAPGTDVCLTYKPGCEHAPGRPFTQIGCSAIGACNSAVCAQKAAAACVGQTFQTGASCPCPPPTGQQCIPPTVQCPPVSPHPQCCYGQTFQTGIQGCQPAAMAAAHCVGQTFQTGASCPCPPPTGQQCIPPTVQCPPVSPHPQCCYGQTFQTGIQGCQPPHAGPAFGAAACVGQTFQTGASCPCPPPTGQQCIPPTAQCPPVSPHPQCCYGQTFQTGIQGCQPAALAVSGPGWTCVCPPPHHTGHPCVTGGPCTGFQANAFHPTFTCFCFPG